MSAEHGDKPKTEWTEDKIAALQAALDGLPKAMPRPAVNRLLVEEEIAEREGPLNALARAGREEREAREAKAALRVPVQINPDARAAGNGGSMNSGFRINSGPMGDGRFIVGSGRMASSEEIAAARKLDDDRVREIFREMVTPILTATMTLLDVAPNDVLVVTAPEGAALEHLGTAVKIMRGLVPKGVRVIGAQHGWEMAVVAAKDAPQDKAAFPARALLNPLDWI